MDVLLHITSGTGPRECVWVVKRLCETIAKDARAAKLDCHRLDEDISEGSAQVRITGPKAEPFSQAYIGTIQWIGQSPFRPRHKRKNWFVGVTRIIPEDIVGDLNDADIHYTSMKAGGPGGQHVNATNSAVRAVHIPTGITVTAREERSQHANRRLCRLKIAAALEARQSDQISDQRQSRWKTHQALERGNAVRVYEWIKFKLR